MWFLRNKRPLVGLGALGGLIALVLFVVVPAVASNPNDFVAPSSGTVHVVPRDVAIGGTGDCANLFPNIHGSYSEYDNVNPKTAPGLASGNHDGATFDLTVSGGSKSQTLDVTGHGVRILGIGIKGGTQSTAYDYVNGPYVTTLTPPYTQVAGSGSVTADTGLHAPAQNFSTSAGLGGIVETVTQFYSISQLTVCYTQGSVSGTVYQDANIDGSFDSGDSGLSGWTVRLYNSANTVVGTATSNASGAYKIGAIFDGGAYTVCEAPPAGSWVQTQPGAGVTCNGAGELKNGWSITPTPLQNVTGQDFGNVAAITCTTGPFGIPSYQVGTCKPTQTYVFSSGTTPGGNPYVQYFVGDPTQGSVPTVEKVTFADPWNGGPKYTQILFEDGAGFQAPADGLPAMPWCNVDPRDTSAAGYPESYTLQASPPSPQSINSSGATSCLISLKISAPTSAGGDGTLVAYIYSSTDSVRSAG